MNSRNSGAKFSCFIPSPLNRQRGNTWFASLLRLEITQSFPGLPDNPALTRLDSRLKAFQIARKGSSSMGYEIDFLPVGDSNGDAICVRYGTDATGYTIHVVHGGFTDTAQTVIDHIEKYYGDAVSIQHMVLSHADNDHATGLIGVLNHFEVRTIWMNRP